MASAMGADAWDERYQRADSVWGAAPNRFVREVFGGRESGRVLDLACGEGRNALWLAGLGWSVTTVDFAPTAVERGRAAAEAAGLDVTWVTEDVLTYRPAAGTFDAVLLAYLQLSADPMATVLARAADAVAPGGLVMVVGHDLRNLAEGVGGPQDPEVLYAPSEIAECLPGLRIERSESVLRPVDGAVRPAIDALVVAVRPRTPQR
jgi:SAM-dependent methyltransferase